MILWIVNRLLAASKVFILRSPVKIKVWLEQDVWVNASAAFNIHAFGETQESALRSFCEDFAALYDQIACAKDFELTEDALTVKRNMNSAIESVV